MSGFGRRMEVPATADAKTEAFFPHESAATIVDGLGIGVIAVPVEGVGESLRGLRRLALEIVNSARRHGQMSGLSSALLAVWISGIGQCVAGHRERLPADGSDKSGFNTLSLGDLAALGCVFSRAVKELDIAIHVHP